MGKKFTALVGGVCLWFVVACGSLGSDQQVVVPGIPPSVAELLDVKIPRAVPRWIQIDSGDYSVLPRTDMNPETLSAADGILDPVDDRPALLAQTNEPATDSPGTTGIIGHNYGRSGISPPFAALQDVQERDIVLLGMPTGILQYTVLSRFQIPKSDMATPPGDLSIAVPGRLVLVTCYTDDGSATYDNFVVVAQLSGASSS